MSKSLATPRSKWLPPIRWFSSLAVILSISLCSALAVAAEEIAKEAVAKAAKALEEKESYSWKTVTNTAQSRFGSGTTVGKTEKGGFTTLAMTMNDRTTEAVLKDGKGALKTDDGWRSLDELSGAEGQQNRGAFMARILLRMKKPAAQAADLAAKSKDLKKADDVYTGELSEDGAKDLLAFNRNVRDASGSVKFWIKDGALSKYEYNLKCTMRFNDNEIKIDRTATVEIKDVDATKIEVPEEAKSKAS